MKQTFTILFFWVCASSIIRPAQAQSVYGTTVTTIQVSPTGNTAIERSINDTTQSNENSVSLSTHSDSGSSQTSQSEDGTTTQTEYNYGSTTSSIAVETATVTRQVEIEFREEYHFNEVLINTNSSTGYSF